MLLTRILSSVHHPQQQQQQTPGLDRMQLAPPRPIGNGYDSPPLMGDGHSRSILPSAGDSNPRLNRSLRNSASHIDCSDFYEQDFIDDDELELERMLTGQRPFSFHTRTSNSSTPVPLGRSPIPFHRIEEAAPPSALGHYDNAHRSPFDAFSASQSFQARESSGFATYEDMHRRRSLSLPTSRQGSMPRTQQGSPTSALHTVASTRANTPSYGHRPNHAVPVRDNINMVLAEILRPGTAGGSAPSFTQQQQRVVRADAPRESRGGATLHPQPHDTGRAPRSQRCQNCDTDSGNTWRISKLDGSVLCNACGYVECLTNLVDMHQTMRPALVGAVTVSSILIKPPAHLLFVSFSLYTQAVRSAQAGTSPFEFVPEKSKISTASRAAPAAGK